MCRAQVYKSGANWIMDCTHHNERIWAIDWQDALISAYGHAAFYCARVKPVWEIKISDGIHSSEITLLGN